MATPPTPFVSAYEADLCARHPLEYERAYQFKRFSKLLKRFEKKGVLVGHLAPDEGTYKVSLQDFDDIKDSMRELAHQGARFWYRYDYPSLAFSYEPPQTISPLKVTTHLMEALLVIKDRIGVIPERVYEERCLPPSNTIRLDGNNVDKLVAALQATFVDKALLTFDFTAHSCEFRWKWESVGHNKRPTTDSPADAPPAAKTIAAPAQPQAPQSMPAAAPPSSRCRRSCTAR